MGKKNRKSNTSSKPAKREAESSNQAATKPSQAGKLMHGLANVKRRTVLKSAVAASVLIGGGALIHAHDGESRELHDLAVIGNGLPTVVQVHDPSCPLCRRLKANTLVALDQMEGLQYRIADLNSSEGREMAAKYGVGKVTLLLFDASGKHVGTVQGVTPVDDLVETFTQRLS